MSQHTNTLMRRNLLGLIVFFAFLLCVGVFECLVPMVLAQSQDWESSIRKFEEDDKVNPPKPGGIVFTGASSIRRWETLAAEMKPLDVMNRGFGGSQYSDLNQYAKRIVIAYRPHARQFVKIVHSELPETWIYVMSIKPSYLRWNEWPKMKAANKLIQDYVKTQERVQYIDVATPMFDAQDKPPRDLFVEDGLHPTAKCYALWTSIIKPVLLQRFGPQKITSRNARAPSWLGFGVVAP